MAKRYSEETKIAAVAALESGVHYKDVLKRFRMPLANNQNLYAWRKKYAKAAKPNGSAAPKTPERVFDDRVRQAILLLRQAEQEVERLKRAGKIKEADTAHLYAGLALRMLQGDNGR